MKDGVRNPLQYHPERSSPAPTHRSKQGANTMRLQPIISAFGLLASVNAGLLRFGCAQLTVQRLDPLVNPGANPSPHLHQIIGGVRNSYGETYVQLLIKPELIQRDDGPYQRSRSSGAVNLHYLRVYRRPKSVLHRLFRFDPTLMKYL